MRTPSLSLIEAQPPSSFLAPWQPEAEGSNLCRGHCQCLGSRRASEGANMSEDGGGVSRGTNGGWNPAPLRCSRATQKPVPAWSP